MTIVSIHFGSTKLRGSNQVGDPMQVSLYVSHAVKVAFDLTGWIIPPIKM